MQQPFLNGALSYASSVWPGLTIKLDNDAIHVKGVGILYCLSNAVYRGGFCEADHWLNWKVPLQYDCSDPVRDVEEQLLQREIPAVSAIGLMTAAKLVNASIAELRGDRFELLCCTTVGTSNAVRAGAQDRQVFSAYTPGTINTLLFINGKMSSSAMVNAIITATEAKTAALHDLGIIDKLSGLAATGTSTDTIMLAVNPNSRYEEVHAYAGSATTIGDRIGRAVYETVHKAGAAQYGN